MGQPENFRKKGPGVHMKNLKTVSICALLIINSFNCLCADEPEKPGIKSGTFSLSKYNQAARFMAGMELPEKSVLCKLTSDKRYRRYSNAINKSWNRFLTKNMGEIEAWRKRHIPGKYATTLFYPFSGPDVLHPLSFFPDARDIIMFGLEPVGSIPDPLKLGKNRAVRYLQGLPHVLNFTLKHAFFVTLDMGKKVGKNPYTGITGIMMFFLAREGYEICKVRKIWLNGKSEILDKKPVGIYWNRVPGVEILFMKKGDDFLRRVRFFRLDISDRSRQFPLFSRFIEKGPMCTTIIKSASYLMHHRLGFIRIRNLILKKSNSILQDDSGMPHRYLSDKIWKISYHGQYHKPLKVFKMHYQKDLKMLVKKNSSGPLPFEYGYGYGFDDMTYHLIYAERKKRDRNRLKTN
jgi:hypothetical protein